MACLSSWGCSAKPATAISITTNGMKWGDMAGDKWCTVDVNGNDPPNKMNEDTFIFCILPEGPVVPNSAPGCDDTYGNPTPKARDLLQN